MQEWPIKSKLDPSIYGPAESAITTELVEREIKGVMTVDEVAENPFPMWIKKKKLLSSIINNVFLS